MGKLADVGRKYIYRGQNGEQVLLDCDQLLSNKSRISMQRYQGEDYQTISELLQKIIVKAEGRREISKSAALLAVLLTAQLIKTSQPVRVLEYGSGQGWISGYLAELLGAFHEKSSLVCFHNTIDLEWMEQIAKIEQLPQISFLAGDFGQIQLQEKYFDIVFINGMVDFTEPYQVICDALRMAADNGIILCFCECSSFLEHVFKLVFDEADEYESASHQKVLQAKAGNQRWIRNTNVDYKSEIRDTLMQADAVMTAEKVKNQDVAEMIEKLRKDIQTAKKTGRADLKIRLLDKKEKLMELVINRENTHAV